MVIETYFAAVVCDWLQEGNKIRCKFNGAYRKTFVLYLNVYNSFIS